MSDGATRTVQTLNARSSVYSAQQNRRFCAFRVGVKREEKAVKTEKAEDGTERVYSTVCTEGWCLLIFRWSPSFVKMKFKI